MGSDYLFSLNNTKRGPARVRLKMAAAILALYSTREGRAVSGIFQCVQEIDARLLAQCQKNYPGELALFAVSRSMRKSGIGRALFEKHLAYLHSQNIREFSCSQTQAVIIRFMSTGRPGLKACPRHKKRPQPGTDRISCGRLCPPFGNGVRHSGRKSRRCAPLL